MKVYLVTNTSDDYLEGIFSTYNHAQQYVSTREKICSVANKKKTFAIRSHNINIDPYVGNCTICTKKEIKEDVQIELFGQKMLQIQDNGKIYTTVGCSPFTLCDLQFMKLENRSRLNKLIGTEVIDIQKLFTDIF
uniref:Uncharacterized protein n=1 Tax=Marseillevirus LCMAC102 TaxID=2506603 RepID=A0A481YT74_9VIRU|nr:MAG: hypothetical protein LCMAC102_02330 [Marseillevirus LCMAC102]